MLLWQCCDRHVSMEIVVALHYPPPPFYICLTQLCLRFDPPAPSCHMLSCIQCSIMIINYIPFVYICTLLIILKIKWNYYCNLLKRNTSRPSFLFGQGTQFQCRDLNTYSPALCFHWWWGVVLGWSIFGPDLVLVLLCVHWHSICFTVT